jgi:hypothetical protein
MLAQVSDQAPFLLERDLLGVLGEQQRACTGCVVGATDCKVARTDGKSGHNAS